MQILPFVRSAVSFSTVAALALHAFAGFAPINVARAADASLVINEVNWAGSTLSSADTWVEVYNKGEIFVASAIEPLTLCADGAQVFSMVSGVVMPDSHLLVRNSAVPAAQSTLNSSVYGSAVAADLSALPKVASDLHLVVGTDCAAPIEMLDSVAATAEAPAPFKGTAGTGGVYSSMQRVATNGNLVSSWIDSAADRTVGKNFDASATSQYGTPAAERSVVAVPSNVKLAPAGSAAFGTSVTVTGTVSASTYAIELVRRPRGAAASADEVLFPAIPVTPDASNRFSVTTTVPTMEIGVYDFRVRSLDGALSALANRSALSAVSTELMGGSTYVVYSAASALAAPVFSGTSPSYAQETEVNLSGTAVGASSVVILKDGEYEATASVDASGAFVSERMLTPNAKNVFTAVATDGTAYSTLSTPFEIFQDNVAPAAVKADKVAATFGSTGSVVSVEGAAGAVTVLSNDGSLSLFVYADASKSTLLAGPVAVAADGSFAKVTFAGSQYATVYLSVKDQAGNVSAVTAIKNADSLAGVTSPLNPVLVSVTEEQAVLGWTPVAGAKYYLVKYKADGQGYSHAMSQCRESATCSAQVTVKGLNPGSKFVFAVAAVDAYGNVTPFAELAFATKQPAPQVSTVASTAPVVTETVPARGTDTVRRSGTSTPTPAATATPAPTPSASPATDEGEVKSSATDDNDSRNWTPWIILAVLLAVAVLATAGYFYWFGGEAGEAALASSEAAKQRSEAVEAKKDAPVEQKSQNNGSKKPKDKRW